MMTIDIFHELFWSNNYIKLDDHMYFHERPSDEPYHWDSKKNGNFDPHYSMNNFSNKFGVKLTPKEIERRYDSIDLDYYAGKKFTIGEYTFYGYASESYKSDFYKNIYYAHAIYMEYHGFRCKVLKCQKGIGFDTKKQYSKSIECLDIFMQLLKDNPDIQLVPCELEEITGPLGYKVTSDIGMTPGPYPQKKHPKNKWEGAGEKFTTIDLDHFIKMETEDGVYKPSTAIIGKIISEYETRDIVKGTVKKIKDLGVNKIQLRNNSYYDVSAFYDLEGVEIKASKSVLESLPSIREFSKDEKAKEEIVAKEKAQKEAWELDEYNDTYTLMQHGKVVLDNVKSYEILSYFENKELKDFEIGIIEAGKKCFEVAPELDKIFFMSYGIYSYTEMSGEKFTRYEDVESINELKDITLPKRLITLLEHCEIEPPCFDKDSDLFSFERGATYIGAAKDKNGNVCMIEEDGDQGI